MNKKLKKLWQLSGPLAPVLVLGLIVVVFLSLFRIIDVAMYWQRISSTRGFAMLFPIGIHVDAVIASYMLAIPVLVLFLLPKKMVHRLRWVLILYILATFSLVSFLECATIPFIEEYDVRPNRLMVEYLSHPKEVFGTVFADFWRECMVTALLLLAAAAALKSGTLKALAGYAEWPWQKRMVVFGIVFPLTFVGARGTVSSRPIDLGVAAFSNDNLANQMALNSTFSLMRAIHMLRYEKAPAKTYGRNMATEEMLEEVLKSTNISETQLVSGAIPFLHRQPAKVRRDKPYNLVIILEESLGAEFTGVLGGLPLTPNLDALSREGLLFTQLYSTGTRSARGIEAVISGFLPTPGRSVLKLGKSQKGFFTVADLLARHGYNSSFIYGGDSNFDNMRSFAYGNGFKEIYDEKNFENPAFKGIWGVSDEDVLNKANSWFISQGDRPFFSLIFSSSNHGPFQFPDGRIGLYEEPKESMHNTVKYADYAIGEFFRQAKKEEYYKNTIFLIVADHNWRNFGSDLVPVDKFRIPGLVIGPDIAAGTYDKVCSQIDLLPSLLPMLGRDMKHPMLGNDVFSLAEDFPGRAIMQFGNNHAYRLGNDVVIHLPGNDTRQFIYSKGELQPAAVNPELEKVALAYALVPGYLYDKQKHALGDEAEERPVSDN